MNIYEEIIKKGPKPENDSYTEQERRRDFARYYAWGCPTREVIQNIKDFAGQEKILEIGAGNGLWAMLLQQVGVFITPTDKAPGQTMDHVTGKREQTFVDVLMMDNKQAIKKFKDHNILMLCWPPFDSMAQESLKSFSGDKLIFIGEIDGCTGDSDFFHSLTLNWKKCKTIDIPRWKLRKDSAYLYIRN